MSHRMSVSEARMHVAEAIDMAYAGEEVTITRHNTPVARLVPPAVTEPQSFPDLAAFRRAVSDGSSSATASSVDRLRAEERDT